MKLKEFQHLLKKRNLDIALFLNTGFEKEDPSLFYFTQTDLEFGILGIPKKGSPLLIVADFEKTRVKKYSKIKKVIGIKKGKLLQLLKKLLKNKRVKKIGINKSIISLQEHKALKKEFKKSKFMDISKEISKLRTTKTEKEIKNIRKAAIVTNKIVNDLIKNFKKFKTETEVARFLKIETIKNNCDLGFPPIVASGPNAALPHYEPKNIKLKKGFCVIDFGVKYNGYCSDVTRTIYLGNPSEKEKELYDFLSSIQENIIKNIKVGVKTATLYNYTIKNLKKYSKYFTHGLGHGIGIEIHELPNLTPKSTDKIQKNSIFTVEPGIYIPNKLGIRIEDDILVNKKGKVEVLTTVKKDLIIIR